MAFSLLSTKVLLGLFVLELSGFSEVFCGLQSSVFQKPNCQQFLKEFEKQSKEENKCSSNVDPICASNRQTYRNTCEFCLAYKYLQATIYFMHYGDC
ncbi:serine protease inhibitor Kazal-type 9-like [Petaurus breviceps papuanus]|uniref:serine protease inhibitor Kazal-type 9-like n=1 Tax=Petaurus breviceps papuanus TaxID=3040969 RepID=UPI0036D878E8